MLRYPINNGLAFLAVVAPPALVINPFDPGEAQAVGRVFLLRRRRQNEIAVIKLPVRDLYK